jgi:hypothetical protein
MSKQSQIIQDLANVYDITVRALISCTFEKYDDIVKHPTLKKMQNYKRSIVFAIMYGCDNALTNHSVLANNDVYSLLGFMDGLVRPSKKLSRGNLLNNNDEEIAEALEKGVSRVLSEIITNNDNLVDLQKRTLLSLVGNDNDEALVKICWLYTRINREVDCIQKAVEDYFYNLRNDGFIVEEKEGFDDELRYNVSTQDKKHTLACIVKKHTKYWHLENCEYIV